MADGGQLPSPGRGMLPVQLTSFLGRDEEAAELLGVVERTRLLTLVGAPGCGKTRLAVELGSRLMPHFPGGVWFVDLAPVTDPRLIANAVGAALGTREEPGRPMDDTLTDALTKAQPLLLVLDNCEHLVDGAAGLARRLVVSCPSVRVLSTSRVALGLPGEQVWNVQPLDLAAAMDLFVDRARLASSGFHLGRASRVVVEGICDRLDGLPLAIELAAAWVRVLSPTEIADRLGHALPLLTSGVRGIVARHETMMATVDWSYQLLPPAAQRLFDRVCVFAGGFDLEAVAAIARPGEDVLGELACLVDHSLVLASVMPGGRMRYRLLEPVRQCGEARLVASGDNDEVRRRHALHYHSVARQFDPRRLGRAALPLDDVKREEGNLVAALEWARTDDPDVGLQLCYALVTFWEFGGRINDGRAWLADMLAADTADDAVRAAALNAAGHLAWRQGDHEQARALLEESQALASQVGDLQRLIPVTNVLGSIAVSEGDHETALRLYHENIARSRELDDDTWVVWTQHLLGWARYMDGDVAGGDEVLWAALATSQAMGNATAVGASHMGLHYGAFLAGDAAAQRTHLLGVLAITEEGGQFEASDWLGCCGAMAAAEGRLHAALRLVGGAAAMSRRRGSQYPDQVVAPIMALFETVWQKVGQPKGDRLYARGAEMTWDELVALAIAESDDDDGDENPLTPRESEVAELVAQGLSNVDIARRLTISRRTVESHVDHIKQKLGLSNRHEVMAWVLQRAPGPRNT